MAPMQAPAFLPGPIRAVAQLLFFSLFNEEDDFTQTLRKVSSAVLMLCSPAPIAASAWLAARTNKTTGAYIQAVNGIFLGIMFIGNYSYLRFTRRMSDIHALVVFTYLTVAWGLTYLAAPDYDPRTLSGGIALLVVLSQPPYRFLHLGFLLFVSVISIYNQVYRYTGSTLLLLPGPARVATTTEDLVTQLIPLLCLVLTIAGVGTQTAAHVQAMKASEEALRMSNEVVDQLREYDTDGVASTLKRYEEECHVSAHLLDSFRAMNKNLELYRPHLPNYVLMKGDEEDESPMASLTTAEHSIERRPDANKGDNESIYSARLSISVTEQSMTPKALGQHQTLSISPRLAGSNQSLTPRLLDGTFRGRISLAYVDFLPFAVYGARVSAVTNVFIDKLYHIGSVYRASIHTTVGDTAVVSWNATMRVAQHELKAARFLLHLQKAAKEFPGGQHIAGAVFTGVGRCDSVTAQTTKQHTLLINAPWLEALETAFRLARRLRCSIINAEANEVAKFELETRAVDRVDFVPRDAQDYRPGLVSAELLLDDVQGVPGLFRPSHTSNFRDSILYQVVAEIQCADDEWMYQLQSTTSAVTVSATITRAFEATLSGRYNEAITTLLDIPALNANASVRSAADASAGASITSDEKKNLEESASSSSPLIHRMKDYCERRLIAKGSMSQNSLLSFTVVNVRAPS